MNRRLYFDPAPDIDIRISHCLTEFHQRHPGAVPVKIEVRTGTIDPAAYRHPSGIPVIISPSIRRGDVAIYSED